MKVLGISFGRKSKNCEILVKQGLRGAESAGARVRFISTINLNISHCTGCSACSIARSKGKQIKCVVKDDFNSVAEAILDADSVLVAAPVYCIAPTGQYKNLADRFGPAYDQYALTIEQEKRKREGAELLDERVLKKRHVGYISVGGAHTQNWVSLGLPSMHILGFPSGMIPVGQIDAYDMGQTGNPILNKDLMDTVFALGKRAAEAAGGKTEGAWVGDDGVCPVCHLNLVTLKGTTTVECPLCGIEGKLSVEGDKVHVAFPPEQQARSRYTLAGKKEHIDEIAGFRAVCGPKLEANKELLEKELEVLKQYPSASGERTW
ncbi:MAG: flavodoxin family protein [Treponema sp.]|jgi:multimeric flavodoxin WrbA/uncharacterized Zn finger protein (UPF0148 family)|nr:flavodoxin family protein [Treponema sp.]